MFGQSDGLLAMEYFGLHLQKSRSNLYVCSWAEEAGRFSASPLPLKGIRLIQSLVSRNLEGLGEHSPAPGLLGWQGRARNFWSPCRASSSSTTLAAAGRAGVSLCHPRGHCPLPSHPGKRGWRRDEGPASMCGRKSHQPSPKRPPTCRCAPCLG